MASLTDTTKQFTQQLENLVEELTSELGNGNADFEKVVSLADELSEYADNLAETFNSLNDTLMERIEQAKSGNGSRSKSEKAKASS